MTSHGDSALTSTVDEVPALVDDSPLDLAEFLVLVSVDMYAGDDCIPDCLLRRLRLLLPVLNATEFDSPSLIFCQIQIPNKYAGKSDNQMRN